MYVDTAEHVDKAVHAFTTTTESKANQFQFIKLMFNRSSVVSEGASEHSKYECMG